MRVGVPSEIKPQEHRVAMTPSGVRELVRRGHDVMVQHGAGRGAMIADEAFAAEGAVIAPDAGTVFDGCELIVKVKEPQPTEVELLRPDHTLFTYLHLAADPALTQALADSGATCIAYETIEDAAGRLPLLAPMSAIAGRIATQAAAAALERHAGGQGLLIGGVPGVPPATVVVIGGGVVGTNAAQVAIGMGAHVHVFDRDVDRLGELDRMFGGHCVTQHASELALEEMLPAADVVIGAVLVHGARAPHLLRRRHLAMMRPGSVIVDVAIDQGGCFETSRATTHADPVFVVDDVVHYCVANMPGAVPRTSTRALTNVTLPYVVQLADGVESAIESNASLARGVNLRAGEITYGAVADAVTVAT